MTLARAGAPADNATCVCCAERASKRPALKIAEIFYSLQGEGSLIGVPSVAEAAALAAAGPSARLVSPRLVIGAATCALAASEAAP